MSGGKVSRSANGKVKLEYVQGNEKRYALWEPFNDGVVETIFDEHGAVLKQEMFPEKQSKIAVDNYMKRFMKQVHLSDVVDETYSEIKLDKKCPTCGKDTLTRIMDLDAKEPNVPILPTYLCTSCKGKSYYLSDAYLEYLVSNNTTMFSDAERKELEANREAFLHELKEYIIRIFASKRIIRIK